MRVGFDSDGVLDNFGEGVKDTLLAQGKSHLWKSGKNKDSYWNFYEDWGWTFAEFKELCDWGVDNGYIFTGHWREGGIEAVGRIAAMGHEVIILTDRAFGSDPRNSQRNTIEAFSRAGLEYDELHFTPDKTVGNVDIMVEDKIENFQALEAAGVETYLINRPWNKAMGPHPRRLDNVMQYADIVEKRTSSMV
jgi:hypothetical protein